MTNKITVSVNIHAPLQKVWDCYTQPLHITKWNFAHPSWHCPNAENDMQINGRYKARMEARDGSSGFDFEAIYSQIKPLAMFSYQFGDRVATVTFQPHEEQTTISIVFDPETEHPIEMQKEGWQAILNNFKNYTEHEN